jgi:basic amino acid/polyamine antiporter, APA family
MGREADLPRWLAAVRPRFKVPRRAEMVLAFIICLIIGVADLRGAIGFPPWRYPKGLQAVGAIACVLLVATLPIESVIAGLVMFGAGILYRGLRLPR